MRWLLLLCAATFFGLDLSEMADPDLVLSTRRILLPQYPDAFNPSIAPKGDGYILIFRYSPNRFWDPWLNYIGAVLLDQNFEPISEPQLLESGLNTPCVKSQAEDARIFVFEGRYYLIYNDNVEVSRPWYLDRRDMYLAELIEEPGEKGRFSLRHPIKLVYEKIYPSVFWQKNWTPFIYNKHLFLSYSIAPHEVLFPNLDDGACFSCYESASPLDWELGILRGSSPALLVDGEYLSFFHSGHQMTSSLSPQKPLWHYFMGAYTFSAEPPFHITKISSKPIVGSGFYAPSYHEKKVILPGGFVVAGPKIFVAYGKDDEEMWIAELDREALLHSLTEVAQP